MKSVIIFAFLSMAALCSATPVFEGEQADEAQLAPLEVRILKDWARFLMMAIESPNDLSSMTNMVKASRMRTVHKRNSELLNSLLGLPKNILKSGK